MGDLTTIQAGDEVVITTWDRYPQVATVTRTTATQVIVGASKYRRSDGREIGGHPWHPGTLCVPTPTLLDLAAVGQARREAVNLLARMERRVKCDSSLDVRPLIDHLRAAVALLETT